MMNIAQGMVQLSNVIIEGDVDSTISNLVLISLFTDARANSSDNIPDGTTDLRGWPGDTFSDKPWGSKLWLLYRAKLTTDVRNRAVKYAEDALAWMLVDDGNGRMARKVSVTGSIPRFQTLALTIVISKPDGKEITLTVSRAWSATQEFIYAV